MICQSDTSSLNKNLSKYLYHNKLDMSLLFNYSDFIQYFKPDWAGTTLNLSIKSQNPSEKELVNLMSTLTGSIM